ncbi:MAG: trypsin-like peptidase domain-containing protein [Hydrogenophaga sp.]|uniref:trypsin-like peptidase domain-containing protein n=1 Tax=Hydrogenophaga sp. TaxID=1904254 RepID=UPI001D996329|nr:trypsin-like peptidase domain-containing protein [Hydrogenophaga sp.]MBX3610850.1 trypsin-like peptidase domain-containing protein [Hydrogenophaga sp.]
MPRTTLAIMTALFSALCGVFSGAGAVTCDGQPGTAAGAADFVAAVARNTPAVVHLLTVRERSAEQAPVGEASEAPAPEGSEAGASGPLYERVTASGFLISPDGDIVTSSHAVQGRREVWAVLSDGRHLPVTVVGVDEATDVALVKVQAQGLPVVRTAPDAPVCPGQWVAALGAPFGFEHSVTAGVVSAGPRALLGGSDMALIQMNVAINPGSSGGPLFNSQGDVVGLNAMIFASEGFYVGISFAVPIDTVLRAVERLRAGATREQARLPARTQALGPALSLAFGLRQPDGVLIASTEGHTHSNDGLHRGDVLLSLAGRPVATREALDRLLAGQAPGASVPAVVWREGRLRELRVVLERELPERIDQGVERKAQDGPLLGLQLVPEAKASQWPPGVYVLSASGTGLMAGVDDGDRIVAVNATPVQSPSEFEAAVRAASSTVVALLVQRGPYTLYVPVARGPAR